MLPLRDVMPSRTFPAVTLTLIGINTATFLLQWSLASSAGAALVERFGLTPAEFRPWTPVTSMFLHRDPLQFGANMLMLWLCGENLEDRTGRARMVAFYLLSGALAGLAHAAAHAASWTPAVGASGAVAGVLGGYFSLYPRSRILTLAPLPGADRIIELSAAGYLAFWMLAQLVSSVFPMTETAVATVGPSLAACAAAFLGGALMIRAFRRPERMRVDWWHDRRRDVRH